MKRFKQILCIVDSRDGAKTALERAVSLAENNQARLKVFVVVENISVAPEMLSEGSRLIGKPQWTALPTGQAMIGAYPAAARAAKAGTARVQMRCVIAEDGAATACALVSETPEGLGFGEAALSLAPHFRLSIWSDEGLPIVGGQVIIPLRYEPPATPN